MTTYSEGAEVWWGSKRASVVRLGGRNGYRRIQWWEGNRAKERTVHIRELRPRGVRHTTTGTITRPFSHSQPEGVREQRKETCWRSKAYLAHARETGRQWGCPGCGGTEQIEAAHDGSDGGMGLKASDVYATGQCHECHRHRHDTGAFPTMTAAETRNAIRERQVRTMAAWIRRREAGET